MTEQTKDYFGDNLTSAERAERKRKREEQQALNNKRLGLLVFQISWIMAFMALVMVNWQLRFSYTSWPPPGVEAMGIWLPTLASGLLLAAVVLARRSRKSVQADATGPFINMWTVAVALIGVFVGIMAVEWFRVQTGTQYSAVFRLMTGFHSLHAIAVGAYMVNILRNARHARAVDSGALEDDGTAVRYNSDNVWAVESASKMLDFVFIAWLLFYVVLYWWRG
ncbi:MAG: cytochrome c oxidase subunit 3 [Chloroflexota bacterium]